MLIWKNKNHDNSSENNDNVSTTTTNNKSNHGQGGKSAKYWMKLNRLKSLKK